MIESDRLSDRDRFLARARRRRILTETPLGYSKFLEFDFYSSLCCPGWGFELVSFYDHFHMFYLVQSFVCLFFVMRAKGSVF